MTQPTVQTPANGVAYLYMIAASVIIVAGLRMAQEILQPFLLAIFISVISVPMYAWLVERKVASWLSLMIVISTVVGLMSVVLMIVVTSLADFTANQDHYAEQLRVRTLTLRQRLEKFLPDPETEDQDQAAIAGTPDANVTDQSPESVIVNSSASGGTNGVAAERPVAVDSKTDTGVQAAAVVEDNSSVDGEPESSDVGDSDTDAASLSETPGNDQAEPVEAVTTHDLSSGFFTQTPPVPRTRKSWRELVMGQFDPAMVIRLVVSTAGSIGQLLSNGILILLTVVFILLEASSLPGKVARAFGSDLAHQSTEARARFQVVIDSVRTYIALKTAISILTGLLIAVWLWFLGVPYAGLWGLFAFLLNYIPNIGSIIAAIPALLIAWLDLGWLPALACGAGFLAVNLVIGNFIEPRVMGRGLGLSPLIVFCSMVFWGWVLGPVGMLASVPLTMAVRVALEGFDDTRWLGILLGN
jgi:predicted PurR-regulated permease PerM